MWHGERSGAGNGREELATRRDANVLIDGALLLGGTLAVGDTVLVHWVLGWHRLIEGWSASLHAEVALVVMGVSMLALAIVRIRRRATGRTT